MIDMTSADICRCWRIPICSQARTSSDLVPMSVESGARAMWRRHRLDLGFQLFPRDDPVDQAVRLGLRGCQRARRVEVLGGPLAVHERPGLDHRLPAGEPEPLHQRHLEVGVLGGDGDVGQVGPVRATAEAVPVDLRDRRLGELEEPQRRPEEELAAADPVLADAGHRLDELRVGVGAGHVVPGTEPLAVGLEDDDLHVVVALGAIERVVDLPDHLRRLRVRLLRPVEHDAGDRAVLLVQHAAEVDRLHGSP